MENVTCFWIPPKGIAQVVPIEPRGEHRLFHSEKMIETVRMLPMTCQVVNVRSRGALLSTYLVYEHDEDRCSDPPDDLQLDFPEDFQALKRDCSDTGLFGGAYIEARYEYLRQLHDVPDSARIQMNGWTESDRGAVEEDGLVWCFSHVCLPTNLLSRVLTATYGYISFSYTPLILSITRVVSQIVDQLLKCFPSEERLAVWSVCKDVYEDDDHPHMERIYLDVHVISPDRSVKTDFFMVVRSRAALKHIVHKIFDRLRSTVPPSFRMHPRFKELGAVERWCASPSGTSEHVPLQRCDDLGKRLTPLCIRIQEDYHLRVESVRVTNALRLGREERASRRDAIEVEERRVAMETRLSRRVSVTLSAGEHAAQTTSEKLSSRTARRVHATCVARGSDKACKIAEARTHAQALLSNENKRVEELAARARLVRIGEDTNRQRLEENVNADDDLNVALCPHASIALGVG